MKSLQKNILITLVVFSFFMSITKAEASKLLTNEQINTTKTVYGADLTNVDTMTADQLGAEYSKLSQESKRSLLGTFKKLLRSPLIIKNTAKARYEARRQEIIARRGIDITTGEKVSKNAK